MTGIVVSSVLAITKNLKEFFETTDPSRLVEDERFENSLKAVLNAVHATNQYLNFLSGRKTIDPKLEKRLPDLWTVAGSELKEFDAELARQCAPKNLFLSGKTAPDYPGINRARNALQNLEFRLEQAMKTNPAWSNADLQKAAAREKFLSERLEVEKPYVFISYSHKDKKYAHRLKKALEDRGYRAWIDDLIDYGEEWPRVIETHIDHCDDFVLVMSRRSYQSRWVHNELSRAIRKRKHILPILLDGDLWFEVESIQAVMIKNNQLPSSRFFDQLKKP